MSKYASLTRKGLRQRRFAFEGCGVFGLFLCSVLVAVYAYFVEDNRLVLSVLVTTALATVAEVLIVSPVYLFVR
jgi:membrane protein YdbS with pleckstrin-like domain